MEKETAAFGPAVQVYVVRHSILNQIPLLCLTALLWFVAVESVAIIPGASITLFALPLGEGSEVTVGAPILGVLPLISAMVLIHRLFDDRLILHPEYLLFREGLMSWKELSSRIEYEYVREVNIGQNLIQKIFNVGDLKVSTVATQIASEVTMLGVRNPRQVKDEIYRRRHHVQPEDHQEPSSHVQEPLVGNG